MIEVKGPDGRVFKFPVGTDPQVIAETMRANYPEPDATDSEAPAPSVAATVDGAAVDMAAGAPPRATMTPDPSSYTSAPGSFDAPDDAGSDRSVAGGFMRFTANVAIFAAIGLVMVAGLWFFRDKLTGTTEMPRGTEVVDQSYQATPQPDVRQASVNTQIRAEARADAEILQDVAQGAVLDVLGEQTVAGHVWARVRLNNATSQSGWVIANHLAAMQAPVEMQAMNALPQAQVTAPTNMAAGQTYYVASQRANLRAAPNPSSPSVGLINFGTAVLATQQTDFEGRIWMLVQTSTGQQGWINSRLLSSVAVSTPIDAPLTSQPETTPMPQNGVTNDNATRAADNVRRDRAASGFYVQVGAAQSMAEVEDLESRVGVAKRCVNALPNSYRSDAFDNSRGGMVLSNFGPFSTREQARAYAARLRDCIPDTYVIQQP